MTTIRFKICRDCFLDAQKETGTCPGCKEHYKVAEYEDDTDEYSHTTLPLPAPDGSKQNPNNMSVMKRNQNGEFDHNKWLFETKGTYGVGNAYWPPDDDDGDDGFQGAFDDAEKPWKPLSRKTPIPSAIISPYRLDLYIYYDFSIVSIQLDIIPWFHICKHSHWLVIIITNCA